jgi:predicted HicB family RNase H-like nuclease
MAQKRIHIHLPPEVHEALKKKAKEHGISMNVLTTVLLAKGLETFDGITSKTKKAAA